MSREPSNITRRSLLKRSAAVGAGAVLAGPALPDFADAAKRGRINPLKARPGGLAGLGKLRDWNRYLAGLGARHTGGESQATFIRDLERGMRGLGWRTERRFQSFDRWDAVSFGLRVSVSGAPMKPMPVASCFPYSGRTGAAGITAELAYAGAGKEADFAAGDFRGKIAVIDVAAFNLPIGLVFNPYFDRPVDIDMSLPYDRSWLAAPPELDAARAAGAAGVIAILPMVPDDAKGQYTPFARKLQGLPALLVDSEQGESLRELAKASGNRAGLNLMARRDRGRTSSLLAVLPGAGRDVVVVNTHTDGPNLIEENGPLAMLSIAQRMSAIPKAKRPSTLAFYFATGHFADGVESSGAYLTEHPGLAARTKAGVTIEHLGCPEYVDDQVSSFTRTGKPEISGVFASNEKVAAISQAAIERHGVTRCMTIKPAPLFFGEGAPLHEGGIPMMAYISGPSYLLAERSRKVQLRRFDVRRMAAETAACSRMIVKASAAPAGSLIG
ncbi:MAG TPA: twin-arginine translocation signal domain-containing protein [Solirubrobacterales bacterium]|nr:twin-arginine translocation signal domain-containing protein [Solirubrobacterales bacterium]